MREIPEVQHNIEIAENLESWRKKKLLHTIYNDFYLLIKEHIDISLPGEIVELGSGIGNLKSVVPEAVCTDLFPNPWLDQVENAYRLSFKNETVSNIILFDVFHHLQYPGSALCEFSRVLIPGGRIIIFDPYTSLLGWLIYGLLHHEPVSDGKIEWTAPAGTDLNKLDYYAAQGNATKIFFRNKDHLLLKNWIIVTKKRLAALSYVASGGYSKPQLYPERLYPLFKKADKLFGSLPWLFATRTLVVIKKQS